MYLIRAQNKFIFFLFLKNRQWIIGFMYKSIQPNTNIMDSMYIYV